MQSSGSFCMLRAAQAGNDSATGTLTARHTWWFSREAGSPVARQVVHAGVHVGFMSSPFPTHHSGGWDESGQCRIKCGSAP